MQINKKHKINKMEEQNYTNYTKYREWLIRNFDKMIEQGIFSKRTSFG